MGVFARRSIMQLYVSELNHYGHSIRIVLSEKGVIYETNEVITKEDLPEEIIQMNPEGQLPVLLDRDLVLYYPQVILEYLDERFPHPPLFPVYPIARANIRQLIRRLHEEFFVFVDSYFHENTSQNRRNKDKSEITQKLIDIAPIFEELPYFMSETYTLLDAFMSSVLWRLDLMEINLPKDTINHLNPYMKRLFDRNSFKNSLLESEQDINESFSNFL